MGYACPVCGDPQADATHLANHLAFTALARGGDHEAWLDETVPEWERMGEDGLAEVVVDHADEEEYPQVFEDTTGDLPDGHDHGRHAHDHAGGPRRDVPDALLADAEDALADANLTNTDDVLAEARELTRERRERMADDETDAADDAAETAETDESTETDEDDTSTDDSENE